MIADDLQLVAGFLARRDVDALDPAHPVDVLVLCGSAVLPALDVAADAFHAGVTRRILLSGGVGHSTEHLYAAVRAHPEYAGVPLAGRSEAAVLAEILRAHLGVPADALTTEEESTNCGENGANSVRLLAGRSEAGMVVRSIVLVQDPTMQRRTHAVFDRCLRDLAGVRLSSFAPFVPRVGPASVGDAAGTPVWTRDRFTSLALGEIRRLSDDADGYGPRGTGFIDHVDIPGEVLAAYGRLRTQHPDAVRPAWS